MLMFISFLHNNGAKGGVFLAKILMDIETEGLVFQNFLRFITISSERELVYKKPLVVFIHKLIHFTRCILQKMHLRYKFMRGNDAIYLRRN